MRATALLIVAVLTALTTGCPGSRGGPRAPGVVYLAKLRIEGNRTIETSDLIPGLALARTQREGRPLDPYQLALDTRRIRGAYVRKGFFGAKVDSRIIRDDEAETVVFTVAEGPRARARVAVTGLPPELPEDEVLAKLALKEGAPFDYELFDEGREVVKALVQDVGYPYVADDSVVTVDRSQNVAVASYRLDSGIRARFGAIKIDGVAATNDLHAAVRGRLTFREGDRYSLRAIAASELAIYELGRFTRVRIEPDLTTGNETLAVTVAVRPAGIVGTLELRAGGGLGIDTETYEGRLRGGLSYVPDEYPLQTHSGDVRVALRRNRETSEWEPSVRVLYSLQRLELLRPRIIGRLDAGIDFVTAEAYSGYGPLLRAEAASPLGVSWLTARGGWALSYLKFFNVSDVLSARARRELHLNSAELYGRFEQSIVADLRDSPIEPTKGIYAALRVAEGTIAAGGAFNVVTIEPDVRAYYPLGRMVIAGHVRAGRIFGDVPMTTRYFSGGSQNHRGFSSRELAPAVDKFDDTGNVVGSVKIGGEALIEAGAELRLPLFELWGLPLGTTLFVDGGDVPFSPTDLSLLDLHWAAGIGLFAKIAAFKIRFDVAKRISRLPVNLDGSVRDGALENINIHLGVGETF